MAAGVAARLHQGGADLRRRVEELDEQVLALLDVRRMLDEKLGEFVETRIVHGKLPGKCVLGRAI
jgi:hypothetical protein